MLCINLQGGEFLTSNLNAEVCVAPILQSNPKSWQKLKTSHMHYIPILH